MTSVSIMKGNDMKVCFDIAHYPHMNFYEHAIFSLIEKGIEVSIIVQPRGNLTSIIDHEYGLPYTCFGRYEPTLAKKVVGLLKRDLSTYKYLRQHPCQVLTGVGSINLAHAGFMLGIPSIMFEDDIEYKLAYYPYKFFSSYTVVPSCLPLAGKNVLKYRGFKELSYLHPNHFKPSRSVLQEYGLKEGGFVFIREVSNTSLNYRNMGSGLLASLCPYLKDMGFDIVLSLEDKSLRKIYEPYCTVLKEPVNDIHSIMHFASLTLASGDSMVRESCLLGTPSIYLGRREMAINNELIKKGCLFKALNENEAISKVHEIIEDDLKASTCKVISKCFKDEWDDVTEVIMDILLSQLYRDSSLIEKYIQ